MTLTKSLSIGACLALAVTLLLAPAAGAALPKPKNKTIVPGKSIGGISTKSKVSKAKKLWGNKAGECSKSSGFTTCTYIGNDPTQGQGNFTGKRKIAYVGISAGYDGSTGKTVVKGKLKKFKTKEGIGLGSKLSTVSKKLKGKKVGDYGFQVKGSKKSIMFFSADDRGKIVSIVLSNGIGG